MDAIYNPSAAVLIVERKDKTSSRQVPFLSSRTSSRLVREDNNSLLHRVYSRATLTAKSWLLSIKHFLPGCQNESSAGRLPQNLLVAGYDRYSAYDLTWQSLHMAAAAACRGSTATGGKGGWGNAVLVRNTLDKKTCAQICAQTIHNNCDAELRGTQREHFSTRLEISFSAFLDCFRAF